MSDPHLEYERWREWRHAYVTSPTGNLALVGYQPVTTEPMAVEGMPVTVRPADDGVCASATGADDVDVDGVRLDGETYVDRLRGDGTPIVSCGSRAFDVFSLDGTDYELRLYDCAADTLSRFANIDAYPYNPEYVLDGRFRAYDQTTDVAWDFTRSSDAGHAKRVPGEVEVELDDKTYGLLAFLDGPALVLVFADGTTGPESYAPGRFLRLPLPDDQGRVTVDFNRSIIPPCGFSTSYSCPLPPPQNRVDAPVRAGERRVVWNDDTA